MIHSDESGQLDARLNGTEQLSFFFVPILLRIFFIRVLVTLDDLHLLLKKSREVDRRVVLLDLDARNFEELLLSDGLLRAQLLLLDVLLLVGDHWRRHDVLLAEDLRLASV